MTRRLPISLLAALLTVGLLAVPGRATAAPGQQCAVHHEPVDYRPWQVKRVNPVRAWPISEGRGQTVAVLDSGVNGKHPQLAGRVEAGVDLVRGKGTADTDCNGHGSIVGGVIAGARRSGSGFYGMAPQATLLPIRIADDTERFSDGSARVATAIRYAVDHHATVINMSLTTDDTDALRSAVDYAHEHDVVLVAATGNEGKAERTYPAAYPEVLAVSGIGSDGAPDSESNTGGYVDLAAPSEGIVGPGPIGGQYAGGKGTSFAAPFVSGTAALVRSYRPELTADEVMRRLESSADHPADGRDDKVGYGVVNPYRALTQVLGDPAGGVGTDRALPGAAHASGQQDPVRAVALWAAVGLLAVVLAVLVLAAVIPAGRRRGWRPGIRARLPGPRSARRRYPAYDPTAPPPIEPEPPATASVRLPGSDTSTTFTIDVNLG